MAMVSEKILNDMKMLVDLNEPRRVLIEKCLDIFDVMTTIEIMDTVVCKCIEQLLKTRFLFCDYRSDKRVNIFLKWLCDVYSKNDAAECCALKALTKVIKLFPKYRIMVFNQLFHPQSLNYNHIENNIFNKCDDYVLSILECMDIESDNINTSDSELVICKALFGFLIRMHYSPNFKAYREPHIILHSLLLLNKITSLCHEDIKHYIAELLGISVRFMFFGNPIKKKIQTLPQKIQPSKQYSHDPFDELDVVDTIYCHKFGGKFAKQKRYRGTKTKGIGEHTLESTCKNKSLEDKGSNYLENQSNIDFRIRITSIYLLGEVTRCIERRYLYSYWQSIFPNEILDSINARNDIFLVCQTDENSRCRCAALQICTELFFNSKTLFSQAEYKDRSMAFVPFAQMIGLNILAAYKALNTIIEKETSLNVLIQALKCSTALVQVTPFNKLECNFICGFVSEIKKLASHKDLTVQVSALTVLECLLMQQEMPFGALETLGISKERLLTYAKYREEVNATGIQQICNAIDIFEEEKPNFEPSWMILKVFRNWETGRLRDGFSCQKVKTCNSLRVKSLHLLSAMSTHFGLFLKSDLIKIAIVLEDALNDSHYEIRLCGSKCLETCGYKMSSFLEKDDNAYSIDICTSFWSRILPIIMNQMRKENESKVVKLALCDALSNICALVFENLAQSTRIALLSFLTGVSGDPTEDVIIRATVVRALSVYVNFPLIRADLVFIEHTAESILRLVKDENIVVRIKIHWSMGNISDALVENSIEESKERISDEILLRLIKYSTEACSDNDKVRCNAVRTVGNLIRLLSMKHFANNLDRALISCAVNKLCEILRSSGTSKVKWNSCHAIGNMLQNENIFLCTNMYKDLNWLPTLYKILCHTIYKHPNYKVKINATTALLHTPKRAYFGEHYGIVWNTILRAIEQSHILQNFYEYNHRDQFQEQLCLVMCHIINLAALDDFAMLSRVLLEKLEAVKNMWTRVMARMIPGKTVFLLPCSSRLEELLSRNQTFSSEQLSAINFLRNFILSAIK